jgi:hypothetical protein
VWYGFPGAGDSRAVPAYVRNISHPTQKRYAEEAEDLLDDVATEVMRPSCYINYGIRLKINLL